MPDPISLLQERVFSQVRAEPLPMTWLLSLLLLAYIPTKGKVRAQKKTAQCGDVGVDGMGIRLLVPGSWSRTRSRTRV